MSAMKVAREVLNYSPYEMADALGLGIRMIQYIESGQKPMQVQTGLAIECLLRRASKLKRFNTVLNGAKANKEDEE